MISGLNSLKKQNISVKTILDVGAAKGVWSIALQKLWPCCSFVLFEPLEERKTALENLISANTNFHYIPSAAGKDSSQIKFYISADLDGSGVAKDTDQITRLVSLTSVDLEIKRLKLHGPFIIKLDTHGYEVPILEGCKDIIEHVSLFIIECYGFRIAKHSFLFWEMCRHMDTLGFRLIDIVDVMRRPKDEAFWQCDAFFVRKEDEVLDNASYV